jgi:DNA-binding transcriptional MerR regulator
MATGEKAPGAFKTIGELSQELGVAQHILRYWESKFPKLKPLQRAGNRRYYRQADVELAHRINRLLNEEGYTVRGVQKLLRQKQAEGDGPVAETGLGAEAAAQAALAQEPAFAEAARPRQGIDVDRLVRLRDRLLSAVED